MAEEGHRDILRIVVDHRERASRVVEFLAQSGEAQISFEHMKLGDYRSADWLFERKTLPDFAASIVDGRLFAQACRLAASHESTAIILEGTTGDLAGVGVHRNALQGALISLCLIYQLPILRSRGPDETAQLLIFAGRQLCQSHEVWAQRRGRRPKRLRKLQLYVLQGLPGIGPRKAGALLERFGTVRRAMAASEEELCEVEGIHRTTAAKIERVLGSPSTPAKLPVTRVLNSRSLPPTC